MIKPISIRPFIGSKDFETSSRFYRYLGFEEKKIDTRLSYLGMDAFGFYLQDYYSKEWIENTMVFMEVLDVEAVYSSMKLLNFAEQFDGSKLSPIRTFDWGKEFYVHDPAGVLWHFGQFAHQGD